MKSADNTTNSYKNLCPKKAKFSLCFGIREQKKPQKRNGNSKLPRFFVMSMCGFFLVLKKEKKPKKSGYVVAANSLVFGFEIRQNKKSVM